MSAPLPPPSQRSAGLLKWLDEFFRAWRRSRILRSEDIELSEGPEGTQLVLAARARRSATGGAAEESCTLRLFDASENGQLKLGIRGGIIAGRQPIKFRAGGVPPYVVPLSGGTELYVYAYGRVDLRTRLFTESGVLVTKEFNLQNSRTTIYKLFGTVAIQGRVMTIEQVRCGPILMSPCETSL